MIIADFSQICISNLMVQIGNHTNIEIEEDLIRHMILNSLRMYKQKFSHKYGEMVLAYDDKDYWRKRFFPLYKANRKKGRENSELDWSAIFTVLNKIRGEVSEFLPYKTIRVPHAEADDVIASLVMKYNMREKILILSGDKDFQQLQRFPNVEQYSPMLKKYIVCKNPELFLKEQIMRGDGSDGVPNFLSDDDCCVTEKRQTPIRTTKLEGWLLREPEEFCDERQLRNYRRNELMIDLSKVPDEIQHEVIHQYETQKPDRSKIFNYFIEYRLKHLMEHINEY